MPKTGGIAFRQSVLLPLFGERLLFDYGDKPLLDTADVRNAKALEFAPPADLAINFDCVHGHFLAAKYAGKVPCDLAVWLRHPVERTASRFFYGKRNGGETVRDLTFAEFCHLERFQNIYAKFLWNTDISSFDFVGITEDYASSVGVFVRRFGLSAVPAPPPDNVNPSKDIADSYQIPAPLRQLIERTNALDMEIYECGKRHLATLARELDVH